MTKNKQIHDCCIQKLIVSFKRLTLESLKEISHTHISHNTPFKVIKIFLARSSSIFYHLKLCLVQLRETAYIHLWKIFHYVIWHYVLHISRLLVPVYHCKIELFVNEQLNPTYRYVIFLKSDRKSTWTKIVLRASNRWLTYAHRDFLRVSTLSLSSCCKEHDVHNRMALLPRVSPCNSAIVRAIAFLGSLRVGRSDRVKVWRYNRSID